MRLLVPFLAFIVASGCTSGCTSGQSNQPLYIGHVATTTGSDRAVGEQQVRGIRLAIEDLAREGIDRVGERPVYVKHTDAHGDEGAWESQAMRLVTVGRVVSLFGGNTPTEAQRLERGRVPLLTPLGARPRGSSELVFSVGAALPDEANALAQFVVVEKKLKSAAIVVDERRDECRAMADAFTDEFQKAFDEKSGKQTADKPARISFGKDADWKSLNQRLASTNAEVVLFAGLAQDFAEWRKVSSTDQFVLYGGDASRLHDPGKVFAISPFAVDKEIAMTEAFAKKYRETFKEEPTAHAALAYDGVRILIDAMRRAQEAERFMEELRQTKDFVGLTGPVSFGPDQQMRRAVYVGQFTGAVFTPLKRYEPRK